MEKNKLLHFLPFLQTVRINRGKSSDCCCHVKAIVYITIIQSCCFLLPKTSSKTGSEMSTNSCHPFCCAGGFREQLIQLTMRLGQLKLCPWLGWCYPAPYFTQLQYNTSLTKICIHLEELSFSAIICIFTHVYLDKLKHLIRRLNLNWSYNN